MLHIWYILAKGEYHVIPVIKDMFHDLELKDECAEFIDKFPGVADRNLTRCNNASNKIQMGTKILGKGQKSMSSTAANQSNCSSMSPLNPIRGNGEIVEMEEQMPELVDDTDNYDSSTGGDQQSQPLVTFGQVCLNNMGDTTKNLGQSINVTFEIDNENSWNTPPNPHVLLRDVNQEQSQGDRLAALSDKL